MMSANQKKEDMLNQPLGASRADQSPIAQQRLDSYWAFTKVMRHFFYFETRVTVASPRSLALWWLSKLSS